MPKAELPIEGVEILAHALGMAWFRYQRNFGEVPHGTPKQLAALIELAGGEDMLVRVGRAAEVAKMARGMRKLVVDTDKKAIQRAKRRRSAGRSEPRG